MKGKRYGTALAVAAVLAILSGCSQEGTLTVRNDCNTEFAGQIDDQFVQLAPRQQYTKNIYIGKSLAFMGPKEYDISISGSAWTRKQFTATVTVKSNETTTYPVKDDVGACLFRNASTIQVNAVSVKGCADTLFGPNLVTTGRPFSPGDRLVIQLGGGCWDILVNYGKLELPDTVANDTILVGRVDTINWMPSP